MSNFRLEAKYVLLTFPSCDTTKEEALARIKASWKDELEWAIVCSEDHQDGTKHLHAVLAHKLRFRTRLPDYFDCIGGKHGDYKPVTRTLSRVVAYVIKDKDYICDGIDPVEFLRLKAAKRSTRAAVISTLVKEGATVDSLNIEYGDFVLMHLKALKDYISEVKRIEWDKQVVANRIPFTGPIGVDVQDEVIAKWLCSNMFAKRTLGETNLWIYGPTGLGKSRLKEQLMRRVRVYVLPYDGAWFDEYEDGKYDLIVADEYKAQYKLQQMNRLLGSEWTTLNRRGRSPVLCTNRLPVLVISNYDINGCYSKTEFDNPGLLALSRRVLQHRVDSRIDLRFPQFASVPDSSSTESVSESPGLERKRKAVTDLHVAKRRFVK